jgi:hypothetical protein
MYNRNGSRLVKSHKGILSRTDSSTNPIDNIGMSGENHTTILRILRQSKKLHTEAIDSENRYSKMEVA